MKHAGRTLDPGARIWIPGHSPVSGGRGQLDRQLEIREVVPVAPPVVALHFFVDSNKRRGHYFDMESLAYVVLASWRHDLAHPRPVKLADPYAPASIWLTMFTTDTRGVGLELVHERPPAAEEIVADVVISNPPTMSIRGTLIPELVGTTELSDSPWLGLELAFPPHVDIGEFGFGGPIKPLIDAMQPLLGNDSRGGPADHRLHDLRICRDDSSEAGRLCSSLVLRRVNADGELQTVRAATTLVRAQQPPSSTDCTRLQDLLEFAEVRGDIGTG